jgi:CRP-like cAMP-binding protein
MVAQRSSGKGASQNGQLQPGCVQCLALKYNLCEAVAWTVPSHVRPIYISQSGSTVRSRRLFDKAQDFPDSVPIICSGWAASVAMLEDGRRQILSFLLPGDIISPSSLFAPKAGLKIEAVTQVRYRMYRREELKSHLFKRPELLEAILKAWVDEETRSDYLIVDLGRRPSDERVARLILNLRQRLLTKGLVQSKTTMFEFPLRQRHIADSAGITQVHVSKVISDFRRSGLIELEKRSLVIRDLHGLHQVAKLPYSFGDDAHAQVRL